MIQLTIYIAKKKLGQENLCNYMLQGFVSSRQTEYFSFTICPKSKEMTFQACIFVVKIVYSKKVPISKHNLPPLE